MRFSVRKFAGGMVVAGVTIAAVAACGSGQQASQPTKPPSAPVQTAPSGPQPGALTVDKAGFSMTGDGQAVWGALVTNHDSQNIAFRPQVKVTFFDAKGTALGTATDMSDSILPGHTVAVAGESASDVIPKGSTPVKATGKAEAVWQIMPRALRGGKVDLSDLKVNFEPGRDIDGKPAAQYNKTSVSVTATSSFNSNIFQSNSAAVCMDADGNIISGGAAKSVDLVPGTPTIIQTMGVPGPQPATCMMSVDPKIGAGSR